MTCRSAPHTPPPPAHPQAAVGPRPSPRASPVSSPQAPRRPSPARSADDAAPPGPAPAVYTLPGPAGRTRHHLGHRTNRAALARPRANWPTKPGPSSRPPSQTPDWKTPTAVRSCAFDRDVRLEPAQEICEHAVGAASCGRALRPFSCHASQPQAHLPCVPRLVDRDQVAIPGVGRLRGAALGGEVHVDQAEPLMEPLSPSDRLSSYPSVWPAEAALTDTMVKLVPVVTRASVATHQSATKRAGSRNPGGVSG